MDKKLIWSNTMTMDYLISLPEEELRDTLVNEFDFDQEMVSKLDYEQLKQGVMSDDEFWMVDNSEWEEVVKPSIESETKDGIVILSGTAGRWDGDKEAGVATWVEHLIDGAFLRDCDRVGIYDDGQNNLILEASHHDGTHIMGMYTVPVDKDSFTDFMYECMPNYIEDELDYSPVTEEELIDYAFETTLGPDLINEYCDFSKVPQCCPPIKNNIEVKESCGADLEEAKTKSPKNLKMELASIKADYEDFGPEGFYAVPFQRFEKEFPEFTKSCIKTFLKELEILTKEELEDPEIFDEYWQSGELIQPDDWPCLIDGAERMIGSRVDKGIQWEKIWKNYYRGVEDESLEEASVIKNTKEEHGPFSHDSFVKDAVEFAYPDEFQTEAIKPDLTFDEFKERMENGENVYKFASVDGEGFDSAVREEIFTLASEVFNCHYDHWYNLWLYGPDKYESVEEPTDESLLQDLHKDHEAVRKEYGQEVYDLLDKYVEEGHDLGDTLYNSENWNAFLKYCEGNKKEESINEAPESDYQYINRKYTGKRGILDLYSSDPADYGLEEDNIYWEDLQAHDAEIGRILGCDLFANPEAVGTENEFKDQYWTLEFHDGFKVEALSGYEIKPIMREGVNEGLKEDFFNQPIAAGQSTMDVAIGVMAAYQNANKWLDIIKEFVWQNLGCVFFSSYIHELAHTMPQRFDKFGDILHTENMRIPYPETPYIPNEPTDIDGVFTGVFMCLDEIKLALNEFIKFTDEPYHGMACAAEELLNDIESEYPTLYKLKDQWVSCNGNIADFDKYAGQFLEHKDDLLA